MHRRSHIRRGLDLLVAVTSLALVAWPFVGASSAALVQRQLHVDQRVRDSVSITRPLDGAFTAKHSGRSRGSVGWAASTTAGTGYKLVVSSDSAPALHDASGSNDVNDLDWSLGSWSVDGSHRAFGFSATGEDALGSYGSGGKWRGFRGARTTEVARDRHGARPMTRTDVPLSSEMGASLPSSSNPDVTVVATAMANL